MRKAKKEDVDAGGLIADRLIDAIVTLITSESAHEVTMFGDLSIYRLEDGRFAVNSLDSGPRSLASGKEKLFTDPVKAALFFEKIRKQKQMGFEFEVEDLPQEKSMPKIGFKR